MTAERLPAATRVCKRCERELPLTDEYFAHSRGRWSPDALRNKCRRCENARCRELENEHRATANAAKAVTGSGKWNPRVVGEGGPEGGYTEHPDDGYRWMAAPDSHGDLVDWEAAAGWLAFARYYKPVRVFLLGDHVDFSAFSRFDGPPSDKERIRADIAACRKFVALVRESCPNARITYLKGNHEQRLQRHLWKHEELAKLLEVDGFDLPHVLKLSDQNVEWEESGTVTVNERLIVKHGHMARMRSGYTATGELERNGVSGISGHTHRLGQIFKRSRAGMLTWVEAGCLCQYDPAYLEGQLSDWQQGLAFGTVSLRGRGFSAHTAAIIKGKVKALGTEIGP